MKKALIITLGVWLVVAAGLSTMAQETPEAPAEATPEAAVAAEDKAAGEEGEEAVTGVPKIACDEMVHNFGQMETGEVVEHTFKIRNDGDATLLIGKVRTSCGCTVANIATKEVAPGEETTVTARLSLKNRRGRQRKAVTVESNDPVTPKLALHLEGDATTQVSVEPNKLYLGQIEEDTPSTGTVKISSNSETPLNITKVESHSEYLDAKLETVEEGKTYTLVVSTKTPLPRGPVRGNVRLTTDNNKVRVIDISVSGTVLDELTVAPSQIVLAEKEEGVTRYVVVRPGKTKEFAVENVEAPVPDIEVNITQLGQNGYQIRLDNVVASKDLDGKELKISTDVEGKEEINIPFKVITQS